jgi:hypothetical protein
MTIANLDAMEEAAVRPRPLFAAIPLAVMCLLLASAPTPAYAYGAAGSYERFQDTRARQPVPYYVRPLGPPPPPPCCYYPPPGYYQPPPVPPQYYQPPPPREFGK